MQTALETPTLKGKMKTDSKNIESNAEPVITDALTSTKLLNQFFYEGKGGRMLVMENLFDDTFAKAIKIMNKRKVNELAHYKAEVISEDECLIQNCTAAIELVKYSL